MGAVLYDVTTSPRTPCASFTAVPFCVGSGPRLPSVLFQRGGFTEDESQAVLAALAHEGVELIEVSGGSYESMAMSGSAAPSTRAREAYFLEYARTVRTLVGDIPLAVTGGFRTCDAMQRAVQAGEWDVVGIGRPTITTPDAARLVLEGRAEALKAHQVHYGMRTLLGRIADLSVLDGVLDISWHTDQIHHLGKGLRPDPHRGSLATTIAMVRRNGRTSFRAKRGGS